MPQLFTTSFPFPYSFPTLVYAVLNKYPATLAPHVISIDVLERELMSDGTIRSERVLGVQQESPKWVNRVSRSSCPGSVGRSPWEGSKRGNVMGFSFLFCEGAEMTRGAIRWTM